MPDVSYLNYSTFHAFLDALEAHTISYPTLDVCDELVAHFQPSVNEVNSDGFTPLLRMATQGWDDLALALVKRHPNTIDAVDAVGHPIWYHLVSAQKWTPDPNSIRFFQRFLPFPPLCNGDVPLHVLARDLIRVSEERRGALFQQQQSFWAFVEIPESLLVANNVGERPLDLIQNHLHLFDTEEQQVLQDMLNQEQHHRLQSAVNKRRPSGHSRKI